MNIQEAKQEITNTLRAYLQKDASGSYLFPPVRQRPILLMGPPGIGKTAIMEQIAKEQDVALVAYTMTHHTRQSAIGLPKITEGHFGEKTFSMTEYTMSEIIASVYAAMERTGKQEGILFLDEINCVSETLAPTMLQFLQNKTFGVHKLPEGWLIVAAGNPPEYNKSVRDFDIVTLDRIRQIQVLPDLQAFLSYAGEQEIHGAVASYLSLKPDRFYHVSRKEGEVHYVTARGWEDLSRLLSSYESLNIPVTEELMSEFLNLEETSRDFYAYYQLYRHYGTDYGIPEILGGTAKNYTEKLEMAQKGDFTERFALTNLVMEQLQLSFRKYQKLDLLTLRLHESLTALFRGDCDPDAFLAAQRTALNAKKQYGLLGFSDRKREETVLRILDAMNLARKERHLYKAEEIQAFFRIEFQKETDARQALVAEIQEKIETAFRFLTDCFGDGQELTLLVSSMTNSKPAMEFIARHGSAAYISVSNRLLCSMNERELQAECQNSLK